MKLNQTTAKVLSNVGDFIYESYGKDLKEFIFSNLEDIASTLQLINDFDLENMVDVMCWTMWKTSKDDSFDAHIIAVKDFVFASTANAFHHFNGDVLDYLQNGFDVESNDEDEDEVDDNDLIPDEVYGDVDPEDVSYLNQLLKL